MELTNGQRAILLAMVRREARTLGYGEQWHQDNRARWPRRLKQLRVIARALSSYEPT